ncbi:MAG TPA: hypothetical protein VLM79_01405 [Kofleriaceae bacterium]|nr:hypothetical protein [Kofleriaceae bacterium]
MRRIVLALVLLSGCSFVFVSGPPANHEQLPYVSCTESRVAPVLDTIFTVLQSLNVIYAASVSDDRWAENYDGDPPIARSTAIPLYAVGALLGAGAAYYGYSRTAACRDAKELALARAQRNYGQPQTWPPQQPYPPQGPYAPPQGPYAPPQGPYAPSQGPYAPPQGPYAPPQQPYPPGPTTPEAPLAPPGAQPPPPPATAPPPPPATPPPPPPNASSR